VIRSASKSIEAEIWSRGEELGVGGTWSNIDKLSYRPCGAQQRGPFTKDD